MIELGEAEMRQRDVVLHRQRDSSIMNGTASNRNCVTKDLVMWVNTDVLIILR